ncbi:Response regulator of the LytR/AlgR family protein [Terricaulis silvestris]|uniref:Response regulator of the LytR/AlgR family protein n=1 Tax=Terricaulis silvestris TaxID=2686094 RepID=A0A6I6MZ73_9CAUL|nr:Response regulator of the LytR/AlgR family protein [Terricaulis silvestris]
MQPELRESSPSARETPASAIGEAPNAGLWAHDWVRSFTVATAAGLFLAFVGAMDSGRLPVLIRLAYWMPLMWGGTAVGHGMSWLVNRIPRARSNTWLFGALLSVVIAVPITFIVWGYSRLMFNGAPPLGPLFGSVLVISVAMTALMILVTQPGRVTHAPPAGAAVSSVRFAERLPAKLKGAVIYAVSAEDHYLRLHTSKGSDLILMRLSDAIAELDGLEGAQTHRSWWVARDAVESARRDGDKMVLTLKGGAEAPVSRPNVKPLRDARWY